MSDPNYIDCAIRLGLATIMGASIGLERERKNQAAGFRTHTILCVGATLVMILSIRVSSAGTQLFDPGRIAAQVVSGIGFLGAGAILRMGANIKGLTTAATIWTIAMIGLALGFGLYFEAILVWAILFVALFVFSAIEKKIFNGKKGARSLSLSALDSPAFLPQICGILEGQRVQVGSINVNKNPLEGKLEVYSTVTIPDGTNISDLVAQLQSIPGVQEVELR